MNYYQEITLIDQMDVNQYHVYSGLYQNLHHKLRYDDDGAPMNIGVAFPKYEYNAKSHKGTLGNKIRLFAQTEAELKMLNLTMILDEYADYSHISSIKEVGDKATHYEVYCRNRITGSAKKARKLQAHFIKKFGQAWFDKEFGNYEAVLRHCEKYNALSKMPFIKLKSTSTGQSYFLGIDRQIVSQPASTFSFDSFGLSSKDAMSTIPAW